MYFYPQIVRSLKKKREHVFVQTINGNKLQMSYIRLEPGEETNHSHKSEQSGFIINGEVEITIGKEKRVCVAGDAYTIPTNIPHGFKVIDDKGVEFIEAYSPPKDGK